MPKNGELAKWDRDGTLSLGPFSLMRIGLIVEGEPTPRQWEEAERLIAHMGNFVQWWAGDLLNEKEKRHGVQCECLLYELLDWEPNTFTNVKNVAKSIKTPRRRGELTYSHHAEVAALDPDKQDELLELAVSEGLSSRAIRGRIQEQKRLLASEEAGPIPPGKYQCLVIDPPWPVEKIEREARPNQKRELDYPTLSVEQIGEIVGKTIGEHAHEEGCHIYLWATHRFVPAAFELFQQWGVSYECLLTWVKPTSMTPYSWMYNTEHVLFGRVGSLKLNELGLKLAFESPALRHSEKPEVFYERVRAASPERRLEMFSRKPHEGFVPWGNESDGSRMEVG